MLSLVCVWHRIVYSVCLSILVFGVDGHTLCRIMCVLCSVVLAIMLIRILEIVWCNVSMGIIIMYLLVMMAVVLDVCLNVSLAVVIMRVISVQSAIS